MSAAAIVIRRAGESDVDGMALAHLDSIRTLGSSYYPPEAVDAWQEGLTGDLYRRAMAAGEVFFIATGERDGRHVVLGFSSDYRIAGSEHGTSVYVRGAAARQGIGSALLREAERHARANGATSIRIEASLAGVDFYKANGYRELHAGSTRLMSGRSMSCVFMRKDLAAP